ncbi:transcriptional modulator of MazE/toxin, MazF [Salegentibacter echinorum]|uniref:Transcriptional modulator of MazE/toxin, MazF n=1 Tax=Salegentibacter echinorum TaxID=1073325 RepID=A0A1M5LVM9_SALEC|nr:type II toxin-antitoxin system PemK/MazF family toxin [Salegentibacter echinorum]SHG69065.1 transcriptional modulator of MazE/toxin, MazF [Salegentibacter echinorum]
MKQGDIVLVSFPFTNLKGSKRRPAVILYVDKLDVLAAFITSKIIRPTSLELRIDPSKYNQLKKTSVIKATKICTLEKVLIKGKLGSLTTLEKQELLAIYRMIFQFD